eukprot:5867518-Prymnesium_polylepis.1
MPSPCTLCSVCTPFCATSPSSVRLIDWKSSGCARERSSSVSKIVSRKSCWSLLRSNWSSTCRVWKGGGGSQRSVVRAPADRCGGRTRKLVPLQ